jgi:hypothetical protein
MDIDPLFKATFMRRENQALTGRLGQKNKSKTNPPR